MSANTSSSSNASLPSSSPVNYYYYHYVRNCFKSTAGTVSITTFTFISILLLLPLYIFVLYVGLQRWRQQRSRTAISRSDLSTYYMVSTELMSVFGCSLVSCGVYTDLPRMIMTGIVLCIANLSGQMCFHLLTCVERYLAVIHPITYRNLRKKKGIRIRNISLVCVWLLCIAATGLLFLGDQLYINILSYCTIVFVLIVTSYCSFSVLRALIRPGPGEGGGARQRVDQSKLRAFYTIMAILGSLLFRFGGNLIASVLYDLPGGGTNRSCGFWISVVWFGLPSSLVLPLLFLQRAGKLPCCKSYNKSAQ